MGGAQQPGYQSPQSPPGPGYPPPPSWTGQQQGYQQSAPEAWPPAGRPLTGYQSPAPRRKHRGWLIFLAVITGMFVLGGVIDAIVHPSPAANTSAATPAATATATTAAPVAKVAQPAGQACLLRVAVWESGTGDRDFKAVEADLTNVQNASSAGDQSALQSAAATWSQDASAALAHPVPSCVDPGGYYTQAMADWQSAATAAMGGDYVTAAADMRHGTRMINKSDAEVVRWSKTHPG
ncbi:MAG: hypothetical protein ACHP9Z_02175 [Streptosporangiales bacterium]